MSRGVWVVAVLLLACGATTRPSQARSLPLDSYRVQVYSGADLRTLARQGFDITERSPAGAVEITATPRQVARLRSLSIQPTLILDGKNRSDRVLARDQISHGGYRVWRPFARPALNRQGERVANISEDLAKLAAAHPEIVKLRTVGTSIRGLPIVAVKVTANAATEPDGTKPAVLYSSLQHAREWISGEMTRRLLHLFADNYKGVGAAIGLNGQPMKDLPREELTNLVNTRELWFVPVCNPDGYDLTFTSPVFRLWRKNLRGNPSTTELNSATGVDLDRNWPTKFNYDEQGSSSDSQSETFRGNHALSEPENQALASLMDEVPFSFFNNYHSAGDAVLYPFGWQTDTPLPDEPILRAIAESGGATKGGPSAIPTSNLGLANGETTAYAFSKGTLAWTTLLSSGSRPKGKLGRTLGSVFPDDEDAVQTEFLRNLKSALAMARAAAGRGVQPTAIKPPSFKPHTFSYSFGTPQVVETTALRSLGAVTVHWQINGGPQHSATTTEWQGGKRYGGDGNTLYRRLRATVTAGAPTDTVQVWFQDEGGARSSPFTYRIVSDSGAPVLIISGENYLGGRGLEKAQQGPKYLAYYASALKDNGVPFDVWDMETEGLTGPDALGVLSHYKAIIWYTGDSYITRLPRQPPGTGAASIANSLILSLRDYLNEGGKLLVTGRNSGHQYYDGFELQPETRGDPEANNCSQTSQPRSSCSFLSADFFQYYLGGYEYNPGRGGTSSKAASPALLAGPPFGNTHLSFGNDGAAANQFSETNGGPATVVPTSAFLNPKAFPQFESHSLGQFTELETPSSVIDGNHYLYSGRGSPGYKRLVRTIDLSEKSSAALTLQTSYDIESDYDYVFVEARTVGRDDWTTLPDLNGHTGRSTGSACERGTREGSDWQAPFPQLVHYQTIQADGKCIPEGTTGSWHAASARSDGWETWNLDLSPYAGKQVEVAFTYVTDFGRQGTGVFVDDIRIIGDGAVMASDSFEESTSEWEYVGWQRTEEILPEAVGVRTADTLWFGFGFEGISGAEKRREVMEAAMRYFDVPTTAPPESRSYPQAAPLSVTQPRQPSPALPLTPGVSPFHPSQHGTAHLSGRVGVPAISVASVARATRAGVIRVKLSCPSSAGSCSGTLILRSGRASLARTSFALKPGERKIKNLRI